MKDKVIHIPANGCHNCRLHCVDHKECASEYPCKNGMEWRPLLSETKESQVSKENEIMLKALKNIANPLKRFQDNLKEGERLDGRAVIAIIDSPNYLRSIAKDCLSELSTTKNE